MRGLLNWELKKELMFICGFLLVFNKGIDKTHSLNNITFYRPPVTSAQCVISTQKYPDSGILLKYNEDNNSQGYSQIKEAFRALTKDDILKPYKSEHDFRSSKDDNDIGYKL